MSQYPSPYQPPTPQQFPTFDYYQPAGAGDVLGPNRRAAGMMFFVAALTFLGAFCCAGLGAMLPQMMADNPAQFVEFQTQFPQIGPDVLRIVMIVFAVLIFLVAVGLIVLGVFVKRGNKAAVVTSIVLVILALLYLVFNTVVSVVMQRVPPAQMGAALCIMVLPIALLGVLLLMLFQALPSSDQARALREQQMQQYWQYAYQQQLYGQQQMQPPPWPQTGVAEAPPPPGQQRQAPPPPPPPPAQPGGPDGPTPTG